MGSSSQSSKSGPLIEVVVVPSPARHIVVVVILPGPLSDVRIAKLSELSNVAVQLKRKENTVAVGDGYTSRQLTTILGMRVTISLACYYTTQQHKQASATKEPYTTRGVSQSDRSPLRVLGMS